MIILDYRDKRPLYEQVVEKLSHLIVCGALAPGSKLPSVRSLAVDLSINPNTIQRAYAILEQEGYIYTVTGRGNYVAESSSWQKGRLEDIRAELAALLLKAKTAGMSLSEVESFTRSTWETSEDTSKTDREEERKND